MPLRMANGDYSTNMAAPYVTTVRTALKGVHFVPARWLLTHRSGTPAVCQCFRLHAARCRPLHVSSTASQCSSRTETQRTAASHTDDRRGRREEEEEEEEEEPEGPEYIPKEKAKNPMMLIGYAWIIGLPAGIISFLLAKRQVDKNRLKQLKVRQRMRKSNEGDYEGSRYHHPAEDVKLDH
ncbi:DUF4748 domain-containing protein [Dicentrarchus labrax]|uniref:DUF4748 domain-containing protein n=1 Tax=Dicentrarchus labrax TaxID=13489 RepID=UPI0021F66AA5|nr:DUF4748 domain-containing protein [Dicentrarchus labrax]